MSTFHWLTPAKKRKDNVENPFRKNCGVLFIRSALTSKKLTRSGIFCCGKNVRSFREISSLNHLTTASQLYNLTHSLGRAAVQWSCLGNSWLNSTLHCLGCLLFIHRHHQSRTRSHISYKKTQKACVEGLLSLLTWQIAKIISSTSSATRIARILLQLIVPIKHKGRGRSLPQGCCADVGGGGGWHRKKPHTAGSTHKSANVRPVQKQGMTVVRQASVLLLVPPTVCNVYT